MLTEGLLKVGITLIDIIYSFLGVLPKFSAEIINVVDGMFNLLFDGVNLAGIFIDLNMVKILIPFAIAIINFDKIAKIVMFVLKKIPIIDIK
jgi:hypothetical protein